MEEKISISLQEYEELKRKARAYDELSAGFSARGRIGGRKSSSNLTPEQRHERAKKAVAARIKKYGQKTKN